MSKRFYISKLIVSGGGHLPSIIDFTSSINFILGPSNTGKSLVLECINYAFGLVPKKNKPSKIVDNNYGYEEITLHIETDKGLLILTRKIGDTKIFIHPNECGIESDNYSVYTNTKKNINDIFLELMGIDKRYQVLSSQKGKVSNVTWRALLNFFLIKQNEVARDTSILLDPDTPGNTYHPAILLFLLTGQDASGVKTPENKDISQARKEAILFFIRNQLHEINEESERLEKSLSQFNLNEPHKVIIENIKKKISIIENEIEKVNRKTASYINQAFQKNKLFTEYEAMLKSFEVLENQYLSDIERLDFILQGTSEISLLPQIKQCPVCQNTIVEDLDPSYVEACKSELHKTKNNLNELRFAQSDLMKKKETLSMEISKLNQEIECTKAIVEENFRPHLENLNNDLVLMTRYNEIEGELKNINKMKSYYEKELFERENEETPKEQKYDIFSKYEYQLVQGFEEKLRYALAKSKIGGAKSARLNFDVFDVEIGGKKKSVCSGGGYSAIINTIVALTMSSYLIEIDGYAPGFFAVDSALTQLSEARDMVQGNTIKDNFLRFLLEDIKNQQVIFIEQPERMAFIPESNGTHTNVIEFTRNPNRGRYGFLNDVYNPEDTENEEF